MPYVETWIDPEVALEYNGTTVYHTYNNDMVGARFAYSFSLSTTQGADTFDVRKLAVPGAARANAPGGHEDVLEALRQAIDMNLLENREPMAP